MVKKKTTIKETKDGFEISGGYYSPKRNNKKITGVKTGYVDKVKMKKKDIVLKIENELEVDTKKLSLRQEKFCQMYLDYDKDLFGNGVQCYLEIYDIDRSKPNWYKTACVACSQLLSNVKVCDRIAELLENGGFNDENITKQHLFLVNQHADFSVKMRAISDYYKVKGKFAPTEIKFVDDNEDLNDDDLEKQIAARQKKS